jgi:hypothetical protein
MITHARRAHCRAYAMMCIAIGTYILLVPDADSRGQGAEGGARGQEKYEHWEVTVSLWKSEYSLGEPMPYAVSLRARTPVAKAPAEFNLCGPYYATVTPEGRDLQVRPIASGEEALPPFSLVCPFFPSSRELRARVEQILGDIANTNGGYPRYEKRGEYLGARVTEWMLAPGKYRIETVFAVGASGVREPLSHRSDVWANCTFEVVAPNDRERAALEYFAARPDPPPVDTRLRPVYEPHMWQRCIDAHAKVVRDFGDTVYAIWSQYYVGRMEQARGNPAAAIEAYKAVLKMNPDFPMKPDLLVHRAECLAALKDPAGADESIEQFEREFPNTACCVAVEFRPVYRGPRTHVAKVKADIAALRAATQPTTAPAQATVKMGVVVPPDGTTRPGPKSAWIELPTPQPATKPAAQPGG